MFFDNLVKLNGKSIVTFDLENTPYFDSLIIYCFTSRSRIFHFYGDVTIIGEGLQCSALRAFEQGRIFIVPHLL
jgi:hypothetical protein